MGGVVQAGVGVEVAGGRWVGGCSGRQPVHAASKGLRGCRKTAARLEERSPPHPTPTHAHTHVVTELRVSRLCTAVTGTMKKRASQQKAAHPAHWRSPRSHSRSLCQGVGVGRGWGVGDGEQRAQREA